VLRQSTRRVRSLAVNVRCINYIANIAGEVKIASAPSELSASQPNRKKIANHSREKRIG